MSHYHQDPPLMLTLRRHMPFRRALPCLFFAIAVGACAISGVAGEPAALRIVRQRFDVDDHHVDPQRRKGDHQRSKEPFEKDHQFENWAGYARLINHEQDTENGNDLNGNDFNGYDIDGYGLAEEAEAKFEFSLTPAPGITPRYDQLLSSDEMVGELLQPGTEEPIAPGETHDLLPSPPGPLPDGSLPAELFPTESLPSLADELYEHGGSYLYCPEGDRLGWPNHRDSHYEYLRLPESWQKPLPLTAFAEFLGADAIKQYPLLKWFGPGGDSLEPRLVGYGDYQLFAFAFEANHQRSDAIGHQLRVDLDLRLTGTERFHVQFRPLGRGNSGGSFYQLNDPSGYIDNSTGEPDRYWFEGELYSIFSSFLDPFAVRDYHVVAGKFPFFLHNSLMINDEILGVVVSKNTINGGSLSNLNIQAITGFNDVDTYPDEQTRIYGVHATADYRRTLFEGTYIYGAAETDSSRDAHFLGISGTKLFGPWTSALRALFKIGDEGGRGSGQLFVLENNFTRVWDSKPCGVAYGVFYANIFAASEGWNSLGGSNFNRLRSAFEVNPLVAISSGRVLTDDIWGVSAGVQLFRHHEDESIIPEVAFESPAGEPVWGLGLRYLRKTGRRTFFEALGVVNFSDDPAFRREGVFVSETIVF